MLKLGLKLRLKLLLELIKESTMHRNLGFIGSTHYTGKVVL